MGCTVRFTSLIFLIFVMYAFHCLKVIPERAYVTYVNDTYASNVSVNVRRSRRGGEYIGNLEFTLKVKLGYNISVDVIFYEYLHNEFRRSFVEGHINYCDLILKDPYLGMVIRRAGLVKCPVAPGKYSLRNVSFNVDIPSVWPYEKAKAEVIVTDDLKRVVMGKIEAVMTFKQDLQKLKKSSMVMGHGSD